LPRDHDSDRLAPLTPALLYFITPQVPTLPYFQLAS
jgi:hypothetical protein